MGLDPRSPTGSCLMNGCRNWKEQQYNVVASIKCMNSSWNALMCTFFDFRSHWFLVNIEKWVQKSSQFSSDQWINLHLWRFQKEVDNRTLGSTRGSLLQGLDAQITTNQPTNQPTNQRTNQPASSDHFWRLWHVNIDQVKILLFSCLPLLRLQLKNAQCLDLRFVPMSLSWEFPLQLSKNTHASKETMVEYIN